MKIKYISLLLAAATVQLSFAPPRKQRYRPAAQLPAIQIIRIQPRCLVCGFVCPNQFTLRRHFRAQHKNFVVPETSLSMILD